MCDGLCVVAVAPSPKFHDHEVGEPVEVSENCTDSGAVPEVGDAVKEPRLIAAAAALEDCMNSELPGPQARAELLARVDALMGFMAADDDGGRGAA